MSGLTRPIKIVILVTAIFMCLNTFIPLRIPSITPSELVAEAIQGPIKLVMTLNKTTYSLGENVSITIEIVNISNSSIKLEWSSPSLAMFTVYDQQNHTIYNSARFSHLAMLIVKQLEPGDSWEVPQLYGEETPAIWNQRDEEGRQVPAGTYNIIAETPTPYSSLAVYESGARYPLVNMKTPALTITIS